MNKGYIGIGPEQGKFVPLEKAFDYALEQIINGTDEEKEQFIEWFYSGNWYKEEAE